MTELRITGIRAKTDGASDPALPRVDIDIAGDRIAAIRPAGSPAPAMPGAELIPMALDSASSPF